MPPPRLPDELPLMVLLVTVSVPVEPDASAMPPPELLAELFLSTQLVRVRLSSAIKMPAPCPETIPFQIVTFDIVTLPTPAMLKLKMRNGSAPPERTMVQFAADMPLMF